MSSVLAELDEWLKVLLPLVSGLATAIWAVLTWKRQQLEAARQEQARVSALYVNPLLLACDELQSRLYNLLDGNGLPVLRRRYPDGRYAEETVYLMAQYFAWERSNYRFGPYSRNPKIIEYTAKIRMAFATDQIPIGPFAFFRTEQKSLGQLLMKRREGEFGSELEPISFLEFFALLESTPALVSPALKEAIDLLKKAQSAAQIPATVYTRLATVQTQLVDLIEYIEREEQYTIFFTSNNGSSPPAARRRSKKALEGGVQI